MRDFVVKQLGKRLTSFALIIVLFASVAANADTLNSYTKLRKPVPTWAMAGNLVYAASEALVLNDGRVFVPPSAFTMSVMGPQVWNPASNVWTALPQSIFGRLSAASAVLNDGRVLVTGGQVSLGTAELFNPVTGQWRQTRGGLVVGRYLHNATKMADGRVLISGGCIKLGCAAGTTSVEIYNPTTDRFTLTGSMNVLRGENTATVLANGAVLVAGGSTTTGVTNLVEVYDPTSGSWSMTGSMSINRQQHTATLLRDGRVLVTGGFTDSNRIVETAEVYDPAARKWTATGSMPYVRVQHSAIFA